MLEPLGSAVKQPEEVEDVPLDDDIDVAIGASRATSTNPGGSGPSAAQPQADPDAPKLVMASRGLSGLIESVGGMQVEEELQENTVLLNVYPPAPFPPAYQSGDERYDVSDSDVIQRVNRILTVDDNVLAGGVFHAGVEVYGKEWCYGATVPGRTGVGAVKPRMHPQHRYRATVNMGQTEKTPQEVNHLLAGMAAQWPGSSYDLIHHNCLSFCNVLLGELGLRRIPGWVDRAARAASQVDNVVKAVRSISTDEVTVQAEERLQSLRRESFAALEAAKDGTQKLFVRAQEQAQQPLSEVQDLGVKASELAGKAQEQLHSVGASLWQWGQNLQESVGMSEAPALSELGKKAEDNWQTLSENIWTWGQSVTQDLKQTLEGPGVARKQSSKTETASQKEDLRSSSAGLIKAQETSLLKQGLLEDEDGDDVSSREAELVKEAPLEWASGKQSEKGTADFNPPPRGQDLLDMGDGPAPAKEPQAAVSLLD